jgi:RecG-like helicase
MNMDIRINNLLQSAKQLKKDLGADKTSREPKGKAGAKSVSRETDSANFFTPEQKSRLLGQIQGVKGLQTLISQDQLRLRAINNALEQPENMKQPLSEALFNKQALFEKQHIEQILERPEYAQELQGEIRDRLDANIGQLRGKQVEVQNILAAESSLNSEDYNTAEISRMLSENADVDSLINLTPQQLQNLL